MASEALSLACIASLISTAVERELNKRYDDVVRTVTKRIRKQLRKRQRLLSHQPQERGLRPAPRTFQEPELFDDSEFESSETETSSIPDSALTSALTSPRQTDDDDRHSNSPTLTHDSSNPTRRFLTDFDALLDGIPPRQAVPLPRASQYSTDHSVLEVYDTPSSQLPTHRNEPSDTSSSGSSVRIVATKWSADHYRQQRQQGWWNQNQPAKSRRIQ